MLVREDLAIRLARLGHGDDAREVREVFDNVAESSTAAAGAEDSDGDLLRGVWIHADHFHRRAIWTYFVFGDRPNVQPQFQPALCAVWLAPSRKIADSQPCPMNERIVIDPKICHGKPVIRGTRTPVSIVVGSLAGGMSFEDVAREYDLTIRHPHALYDKAPQLP